MAARLVPIPAYLVARFWPVIHPMLVGAAKRSSGKVTALDLLRDIRAKRKQVWAAELDGKIVATGLTEILNFPQKRVCRFIAAVGHSHAAWSDLIEGVEAWARTEGCKALEPVCRPGWQRALQARGYRVTHLIMEKEL